MPAPEKKPVDLGKLLSEAVLLQESARPTSASSSSCRPTPCSPSRSDDD
jgi:hypothetical protein